MSNEYYLKEVNDCLNSASKGNVVHLYSEISVGWSNAIRVQAELKIDWVNIQPILIQSIVSLDRSVEDGNIISMINPAWDVILEIISKNGVLPDLEPRTWEELIAASYDKAGYDEVILTPRSGDLGRDVIAIKKGWGCVKIIDQVKAYKKGHLVTANDVRALLGVLQADHSATKGVVTTTSDFAPKIHIDRFIEPFIPYRLELINGNSLKEKLLSIKNKHFI